MSPRDPWGSGPPEASGGDGPRAASPSAHPTFDGAATTRYAETTLLGRGSMGRVVGALDRRLGRMVAVKIADGADVDRFAREAQLAGRLDHPGIVTVHDTGRGPDGRPYYVMRLVRGHTMQDELDRAGPQDRVRLVRALLDAARAVAHAHDASVVHRDLKPANLLLTARGAMQVGDWGLARDLTAPEPAAAATEGDAFATRQGAVLGTPAWISPEAARAEPIGPPADVFALGAVLCAILGGGPPWGEGDAAALLHRARSLPAAACPPGVPPELAAISARATRRDPAERYPDAGALAEDLAAWLDGDRVTAYEYSSRELLQRLVTRLRAPLAVGALALVVLFAVAANAALRIVAEERRALAAEAVADEARQQADQRLASSLTLQAVTAAADLRWPEAAVFAAHAVALSNDLRARGVLAQVAAAPAPTLQATGPLPCERPQPDPLGRGVMCVDATRAAAYGLPWTPGAPAWWTLSPPPLRALWRGVDDRVAGLDPKDPTVVRRWSARDGAPQPGSRASWTIAGHDLMGTPGRVIAWPSGGALVSDDGTSFERTPWCAPGDQDRGATWQDEGAAVAMVCYAARTIVTGPPRGPARVALTLPPEVDANAVLAVHHDRAGWTLALFGGVLVAVDEGGRLRWQAELPIGNVRSFVAGPDLAAMAGDGGPLIVDLRTGAPLARLPAIDAGPLQLDGDTLHTWGRRHATWSLQPLLLPPVLRMDAGLGAAAWSADGAALAIADGDGDVAVHHDVGAPTSFRWQSGVVKALAFLPDGTLLGAAMGTLGIAVLSPAGEVEAVLPQTAPSRRLAVLADGSVLTTPIHEPVLRWQRGPDGWTSTAYAQAGEDADVAPGGHAAVVASGADVLRVGDGALTLAQHLPGAQTVAIGPQGEIVVGLVDRTLRCAPTCEKLPIAGRAQDAAFSADGWLAAGLVSGDVIVLRPRPDGMEPVAVLDGHTDRVAWVGWRPGRRELATASWDGTARRWDLRDPPGAAEVEARWGVTLAELWE